MLIFSHSISCLSVSETAKFVDLYEPTKVCIDSFFPHVVKGGIVILDDYGAFPGANKAIEEFIDNKNYRVEQLRYSNSISFITKT